MGKSAATREMNEAYGILELGELGIVEGLSLCVRGRETLSGELERTGPSCRGGMQLSMTILGEGESNPCLTFIDVRCGAKGKQQYRLRRLRMTEVCRLPQYMSGMRRLH